MTIPMHSSIRFVAAAAALVAAGAVAAATYSSEATITVTGGPHAGSHSLKVPDVGCEVRKPKSRPKYFNDNFGLEQATKDPNRLSFVLVNIRNADGPGSPAPADFEASVSFGPIGGGGTYYMSGKNNTTGRIGGPGKVQLREDGKTAQVTLDLQPQDGIVVKGTVSCTIIQVP